MGSYPPGFSPRLGSAPMLSPVQLMQLCRAGWDGWTAVVTAHSTVLYLCRNFKRSTRGPADVLPLTISNPRCCCGAATDDAAVCVATLQRAAALVSMLAPNCQHCQLRWRHAAVAAQVGRAA